jgi:hypothetical protein
MNGSPPLSLARGDIVKLGKSLGLAVGGALISVGVAYVGDLESTHYAWLVPIATVGLNTLRKFVTDTLGN